MKTLKVGFRTCVSDLGTTEEDLGPAVMDAHEAKINAGCTAPAIVVAAVADQDATEMDAPDTKVEATDDEDDDDDGGEGEGEFQVESGADADAEEDIDTAPDNVEKVILQPMDTVVLPDDKAAALCYLEKAMLGFGCFLEDMSFACAIFAAKQLKSEPCDPH